MPYRAQIQIGQTFLVIEGDTAYNPTFGRGYGNDGTVVARREPWVVIKWAGTTSGGGILNPRTYYGAELEVYRIDGRDEATDDRPFIVTPLIRWPVRKPKEDPAHD